MAQFIENPLRITLSEIPDEGRNYQYSQETGELSSTLKDLLGKNKYSAHFNILPIGNAFEIKGSFTATLDLLCSRCGHDMTQDLTEKFHEILLVEESRPRKSRSQHEFRSSGENSPFCNYLPSEIFHVGDYIHELMASNEPFQPFCERQECLSEAAKYQIQENMGLDEEKSPFAALKSLKIDRKTPKH